MKFFVQIIVILAVNLILAKLIQESGYSPHRINGGEIFSQDRRIALGDSLNWANPGYDDRHWSRNPYIDTNAQFWLRETLFIRDQLPKEEAKGVAVNLLASYEIYWDGHFLGKNGSIGQNESIEVEGQHFKAFVLPDSLVTPGSHTLAFRSSNFHLKNKIRPFGTWVGIYEDLIKKPLQFTALIQVLGGIFLVIGLYNLIIFFINHRQLAYLFFGFLCLVFFVLILFEYLKFHYWYPYSFHYVRLEIIELLTLLFNALLFVFFLYRFQLPRKGLLFGLFTVLILCIKIGLLPFFGGHDMRLLIMSSTTFYIAAMIIIWAYLNKKPGSREALFGIIPCLFLFLYYDLMLFLGFSNLVFFNLLSFSLQQKQLQQKQQATLLRSARLETELIKKNIQPHYLMNTLTSLLEWVEKDPKVGALFIEALANEFKMLSRISDKQLIPLSQEIELCRSHLKIMSYRKGKQYHLELENIPEQAFIPPAMLLTLIENGISHNQSEAVSLTQKLTFYEGQNFKEFKVQSNGVTKKAVPTHHGTGFKYVKARLEESYPGKWAFQSQPNGSGWESIIRIFN